MIEVKSGGGSFRPDIQGLRAIAVLAVVLFHFEVPYFQGGFIGVDVFFVISGFLMTRIILRGIDAQDFSLLTFYAARARRIIPALGVLCLVLLVAGWFWLAPLDYETLGRHAAASVGFYSNFTYKQEAGYFDAPAQFKWLLHTWSLSVEWQFYLLYPLVLLALSRIFPVGGRGLLFSLWAMAGASLLCSAFFSPVKADFAFYLLPTRIWEMVAGGLAFYHGRHLRIGAGAARLAEMAGLCLILLSILVISEDVDWPGWYALLPVCGTALILYSGHASVLRLPWLQTAGAISYSVYLWHWPLVVAIGYFTSAGAVWTVVGILLSFGIGWVSWRLVEMPARKHRSLKSTGGAFLSCAVLVGLVIALGWGIVWQNGFRERVPAKVLVANDAGVAPKAAKNGDGKILRCGFDPKTKHLPDCVLGEGAIANPPVMLIGDSHAGAIATAVAEAAEETGYHFYGYRCTSVHDADMRAKLSRRDQCPDFNRAVLEKVRAMPENGKVILLNRYSISVKGWNEKKSKDWGLTYYHLSDEESRKTPAELYRDRLTKSLCAIQAIRPTAAVLPIPEMGVDVPKVLARQLMLDENTPDIHLPLREYHARNDVVLEGLKNAHVQCGVELLDPVPYLCADGVECTGSQDGHPLYYDDDHLNAYGASLLVPMLRESLKGL